MPFLELPITQHFAAAANALRLVAAEAPEKNVFERARDAVREKLGPPLRALHEPLDAWLGGLPMWIAITCAMGLYLAALLWVWRLRREFVFQGAPDRQRWRDLRIWATGVLLPYIAVYLWLGR